MSPIEYEIKRVGPPQILGKIAEDYFELKFELNQDPNYDWKGFFKVPSKWKDDEAHPRNVSFDGHYLLWNTSRSKIKDNIEWLEKYINQANEKYNAVLIKRETERKRKKETEKKTKAEIDRLNKELVDI